MKIDRALIFHRSTFPGSGATGGRMPIEPNFFKEYPQAPRIELPRETLGGAEKLRRVIVKRRSCREFSPDPLTLKEISDLLYLTLGVTAVTEAYGIDNFPLRAAPSAGALAPIELYPTFFNPPEGLERGLYHYNALKHALEFLIQGDLSEPLVDACLGQEFLARAPIAILFTAVYPRSSWKYGIRAYRYIHLDAGFAGENLYLAATSMGLGTVAIGAFDDEKLSALLGFNEEELPMLVMPVGKRSP